jgi:transposase
MGENTGKRYDEDFKESVIKMVLNGRAVYSVAKDLGVNKQTVNRWLKEYKEPQGSENCRVAELEADLRAERKRVADLDETVAILKKATAIFANPRK